MDRSTQKHSTQKKLARTQPPRTAKVRFTRQTTLIQSSSDEHSLAPSASQDSRALPSTYQELPSASHDENSSAPSASQDERSSSASEDDNSHSQALPSASRESSDSSEKPRKITKCRWFHLTIMKDTPEEDSYHLCKYLWVLSKSFSKKTQWVGCNINLKDSYDFDCLVYFKMPVKVDIFSEILRTTWKDCTVKPVQKTDGPYAMPKLVARLLEKRSSFQERGSNAGVPYFSYLGEPDSRSSDGEGSCQTLIEH